MLEVTARIITQGSQKEGGPTQAQDSELQSQPLFRDPALDAFVRPNRVAPAARLEIAVEHTQCDAGTDHRTRLRTGRVQRERDGFAGSGRIPNRSPPLPFRKHRST